MNHRLRIFIAPTHALVPQGSRAPLGSDPNFNIIGEART